MTQTTPEQSLSRLLKVIHEDLATKATFSLKGMEAFTLAQRLMSLEAFINQLDNGLIEIVEVARAANNDNNNNSNSDEEPEDSIPF